MNLKRKCATEALGTCLLAFVGYGSMLISDGSGTSGLLAALAFGMCLTGLGYGITHISGCHLNPAVSIGLYVIGRLPRKSMLLFMLAQTLGAAVGVALLLPVMADLGANTSIHIPLANGYGDHSPRGLGILSSVLTDMILSYLLILVTLGANDGKSPQRLSPLAAGSALTAVCLAGIPLLGLPANPALSTGAALSGGLTAGLELWVFWLAPLMGGLMAGKTYRAISRTF